MIVGFTGTRSGMGDLQETEVWEFFRSHDEIELALHGGCVGADYDFHKICVWLGVPVEVYPGHSARNPSDLSNRADLSGANVVHPSDTHFARNRVIVESCNHLLACPFNEIQRGGTWYTINYAKQCLVPTTIFEREY